jgi:hypothetical protein
VLVALAPSVFRLLTASLIVIAVAVFVVATVTMPNAPEMYRDPLYDLWLPRLLNQDLAETIASLRWGLPGIQPLAIFVLALALALTALVATFRPGAAARRFTAIAISVLVLLIALFALPFWPPSTLAPG